MSRLLEVFYLTTKLLELNPKKSKIVIPIAAEKLGLPEDMVRDAYEFFWSDVRKAITEIRHHRLKIENFGDLEIRKHKIEKLLNKNKDILKNTDRSTFKSSAIYDATSEKIVKLERAYAEMLKEIEDRESFKNKDHD